MSRKGARRHVVWLLNAMREAYEGVDFAAPTFAAAHDGDVVLVVAAGWRADELREYVEREWDGHFQDASTKAKCEGRWTLDAARCSKSDRSEQ